VTAEGAHPDLVHLDETPGHECGVFAVYAPGQPVAHLTYLGLYALQHRGQESAGMAVSDGESVTVVKDMGLVSNAFDDRMLAALTGHLAIGHTRYSTTGSSQWCNAQPFYRNVGDHSFALAHNGNLVNTGELVDELGMFPGSVTSDSDLVAEMIEMELGRAPGLGDGGPTDDSLEHALATVADLRNGTIDRNNLVARLADDSRIGLERATLDAILAQGDRESGAAKSQVAAFATAVEKITQAHPKAASYMPGSIL